MMYFVFNNETDIDAALLLLDSKYKYQILDSRWITPSQDIIPDGLPAYTTENESLSWYAEGTKQYDCLKNITEDAISYKLDKIEEIYLDMKKKFVIENTMWGITELGQTDNVLAAFADVEYAMRSYSVYSAITALNNITRSSPFLTDERLNAFRDELLYRVSQI